ncbi:MULTISPECIES: DMT family transporter [Bifidobacterium]|jgi:small multidrug resistance pump|uniref:QacE family quaternary ammonium compound efflux SMR transporter n=1 Tax=Bifidobacterium tibiigranuli TaxID=2172043 RepID=A0A5N6S4C4_9BIFI|nr:multidrug efflux SMR transporter [Bifidobacterium tibiigranuli]KAE8129177.1 QacE family quaternary ammonium compound efflux SMR transporter [Bifidobacterium tibiigranuli]KAE8129415.1 QacE family quaternary ammonium compound efflux SMR transporter [Bifidobacterium tibiigranuli]MCH3975385.1 multidrug efflux SMR transporter [Bifidobacterium tibiigranuli]MCH4189717.1 multidrug efflux SMR transporter [Bifidobacterium tibiigranuli]MCH4204256.1 multidrug efflux SMR transporter [Bifidobacterium tib
MSWLYLLLAIGCEVLGTTTLKGSQHLLSVNTAVMLSAYGLSLVFLSLALKRIDIGVAYAIWSGLGITAIEVIGVLAFHERLDCMKIIFIALILVGTIGLNFTRVS